MLSKSIWKHPSKTKQLKKNPLKCQLEQDQCKDIVKLSDEFWLSSPAYILKIISEIRDKSELKQDIHFVEMRATLLHNN